MSLKLVFMGTPDFSVPVLKSIIAAGHEVRAVYSQPPRKSGRGMKLTPSPVHAWAEARHIPVLTPTSLKDTQVQKQFEAFDTDAAVVVAYGLLLPQAILDTPKHGCFNVHASLLPRWRGAAPIQRAIMAGDDKTGVTIMQMEAGLDTGPMCLTAETPISNTTMAQDLHDELARLGARLMVSVLQQLETDTLTTIPQPDNGVTYAAKIDKAEARIDFNQPAASIIRHIHGLSPFPGAWFELPVNGKPVRVKILKASISDDHGPAGHILDDQLTIAGQTGAIKPTMLQRPGKSSMTLSEFLNGTQITPGVKV